MILTCQSSKGASLVRLIYILEFRRLTKTHFRYRVRKGFPPRDIVGNVLDNLQPDALNLVNKINFKIIF